MTQNALKDKDLQTYYEALFAMYPTDGWRVLCEDMARLKELYSNLSTVDTVEELYFRKGQLSIIEEMLTHAQRSEGAFNLALEDEIGQEQTSTEGKATVIADSTGLG